MKVKINRVRGGSMGDQRDYGLVTGSIWNYELKPDTNRVSDTLSPVPRDEANIEAERGETIVGDLNNDGMVEHAIVGGKRHFQGGTPLNVPDGSFVFSDFNKLKIKNKDLLKGIFNYGGSKGATPAQIAKRYELNKYIDILNDPESDPLDKKTAQLMLDNNMRKLGQLALVQEGMKGFPDGIPDIAKPALNQMKKGGLVKAQEGKSYKSPYGHVNHPAADNPLNYYNGDIYQQNPDTRVMETALNMIARPVSALTYPIDPRAKSQSYLSYLKNSPHELDMPLSWNKHAPFMGYSFGADMTDALLSSYQTAGQIEEDEERGMWDMMKSAGYNMAQQFLPLYGLYQGAKAIAPKVAPYIGSWWERTVPPVNEVVPMINPKTGKPYTKGLVNPKTGKPYTKGPKAGRAVELEIDAASKAGVKPTLAKAAQALKSTKGKSALLAAIALYGANVAYQMFAEQEDRNRIPEKPAAQPNSIDSQGSRDSIGALNYQRKRALNAAREAARAKTIADTTRVVAPVLNAGNVGSVKKDNTTKVQIDKNTTGPITDTAAYLKKAGIFQKQGGHVLPRAQEGYYKIQDPSWSSLGQDFQEIRPGYYPGWKSVGYQRPSQDPGSYVRGSSMEILPRIGFKNPTTGATYSGMQDFIDYSNPYVNFEDYGADQPYHDVSKGLASWQADMSSNDPDKRRKAGDWLTKRANAYNQAISNNPNLITIDPNQKGYWELGTKNLNIPFLKRNQKQAVQPQPPEATAASSEAKVPPVNFQGYNRPTDVGYSPEDTMGIGAAFNQQLADYMLTKSRYNPTLISPAYLDPDYSPDLSAYRIAAEQSGMGPAARGSMTGMAGKLFENLNRTRQGNKASNLDTYFKTSLANQQELGKANLYEAEENKDYINRLNTLINSNTLDQNTKQALIVKAISNAETNRRKLNNINAMMPYQYSTWDNTYVNPTLNSIYDSPVLGYNTSSAGNFGNLYDSIYARMIQSGADPKEAALEASRTAARLMSGRNQGFGTAGSAGSIYDLMEQDV